MADPLMIGGVVTGLKTAGEMAGAFVGLRDQAMIQAKVIELQSVILAAQNSAMAAQGQQSALLETKRDLEAKIAELEAWEREKARYHLHEVRPGAFVYAINPDAQGAEPAHQICSACYQRGHKSILQQTQRPPRIVSLSCHDCGLDIVTNGVDDGARMVRPAQPRGRVDVFRR